MKALNTKFLLISVSLMLIMSVSACADKDNSFGSQEPEEITIGNDDNTNDNNDDNANDNNNEKDLSKKQHIDVVYALALSEDVMKFLTPQVTITTDGESKTFVITKEDCVSSSSGIKFNSISASFVNNDLFVWTETAQLVDFVHNGTLTVEYSYKDEAIEGFAKDFNLVSTPKIAAGKVVPGVFAINSFTWISITINIGTDITPLKHVLDDLISNPQTCAFSSDESGKIVIQD